MTFTLGDDGTLDTVLVCGECGETLRFNPPEGVNRVQWAVSVAEDEHECGECSGPATCVDHSEAYAEAQEG